MTYLPFLFAVTLAATGKPSSPERVNALAFDNGAVLLSDGGSYGSGVENWSAWRITDGDEQTGWCSPQGKPVDLEFVWDLDTHWSLDTFAISTHHLQEDGYTGISVKTVELLAGDGTAFKRLGQFEIGKDERREYPLPKGTSARQIKLVVKSNHGNAEYTEIAEVELFGARTGAVPRPKLAGEFQTNYGPMRFVLEGDQVFGCYDWTENAQVAGSLVGRNARVTWTEYPNDRLRQGTATFAISPDGNRLWGVWFEDGQIKGEWAGNRVSWDEGPKCSVKKQELEALRKNRRMILYGIRFDSNSDEPRPESNPTLDHVAQLLKQESALKLLVEGHTDSTNTDAFNLDLSQRRAQRVTAALVKRGVKADRLQAKGFGRTKPVADNATAQGRALNRRVEISLRD